MLRLDILPRLIPDSHCATWQEAFEEAGRRRMSPVAPDAVTRFDESPYGGYRVYTISLSSGDGSVHGPGGFRNLSWSIRCGQVGLQEDGGLPVTEETGKEQRDVAISLATHGLAAVGSLAVGFYLGRRSRS